MGVCGTRRYTSMCSFCDLVACVMATFAAVRIVLSLHV